MLMVFENRVLRGIFGSRNDDLTGGSGLHKEEFNGL